MQFLDAEIEAARQLRQLGLAWKPAPGHFVFDETGIVDRPSPFQPGVYFILNYDYFMQLAGGAERFAEIMTWLPAWHDARAILQTLDVPDDVVAETLQREQAIRNRRELLVLYRLIEKQLRR